MRDMMTIYKCKQCREPFSAREADRKRGWALYCSKSCKAKRQTKMTGRGRGGFYQSEPNFILGAWKNGK